MSMTGPQFQSYDRIDVTTSTNPAVFGVRALRAAGCLIHTTSGKNSLNWLTGDSATSGQPASADALIDRAGKQYLIIPDGHCAYHAGRSRVYIGQWYFNAEVNQILLGIELECLDTEVPTWPQYDSCADLILYFAHRWQWRWPFFLFGHANIAVPYGRRADPVSFDWGDLMGRLYARSVAMQLPGLE